MKLLHPKSTRTLIILILLIFFLIPVLMPLFYKGFFVSDDGEWMVIRFSAFYEAIRSGQFPVRFLMRLNQGYGYPVANFLYPGFMYLGVPLHVVGFSFVDTVKILMGASIIASVVFCYLWLRMFFSEKAAVIGALFYGYAPYHLYDLYTRGNIGELLVLAFAPFVLWQLERKSLFWSCSGLGILLIMHNTLAVFFFLFLLFYLFFKAIVSKKPKTLLLQFSLLVLVGLGLSAFFWIPAVSDLRYTIFSETVVSDWQAHFSSLWLVGLQTYLIFVIVLMLFLSKRVAPSSHHLTILLLFLGLVSTFFATVGSTFLWQILPVSFVQFPFRFLSISILCASFLIAFLFSQFSKRETIVGFVIALILTGVSYWQMVIPVTQIDKGEGFYATNLDTTTVRNEYMPRWVNQLPSGYPHEKVSAGDAKVTNVVTDPNSISFMVQGDKSSRIEVKTIDFPGWEATIDSKKTEISHTNPLGVIELRVPPGFHDVQVVFKETFLRRISNLITLVSFVTLVVLLLFYKRNRWF
ncbi:MAG: hypothetical protein Q8Q49_01055 [bacterium]|nr:hypothetical protein [bacterium]